MKTNLLLLLTLIFSFGCAQKKSDAEKFSQQNELKSRIEKITENKNATVGISVKGIDFDFEFNNENAEKNLPMLSVFKFHIALAVLNEVDKGNLDLNQKIFVKKSHLLENTWSPIREKYPDGNINLSLSEIIEFTVSKSDNNGCDILLNLIGGPNTVQQFMNSKGVKNFQIKNGEKDMTWKNMYYNYTTTESLVELYKDFYEGKLLSKSSTDFLMKIMLETSTGANKLKEQLPKGTSVAHKTGSSGKNKDGLTVAENDAGIVTLADGKHYAITVFINDSTESEEVNCKMISDISKAVYDYLNPKK